jgi:hypothetical protein
LLFWWQCNNNNNNNNTNNNTNNNWRHWNSNEKLKEKFGSCTRKTFDRFTSKDSCTWNITLNTESTGNTRRQKCCAKGSGKKVNPYPANVENMVSS